MCFVEVLKFALVLALVMRIRMHYQSADLDERMVSNFELGRRSNLLVEMQMGLNGEGCRITILVELVSSDFQVQASTSSVVVVSCLMSVTTRKMGIYLSG